MPLNYRARLYQNYSQHVYELGPGAVGEQWRVYECIYRQLLANRALRIADIGCGRGEWLRWMRHKGYSDLTGFEFSEAESAVAEKHGSDLIICGDAINALRSFPAAFDVIHAKDVIEHFTKDEMIEFLDAARSALRPHGALWLLTFNAQAPLANSTRFGDFTHENGFTPTCLAQVLRATGYRVERISGYVTGSGSPKSQLRKLLYDMFAFPSRVLLILRHGFGSRRGYADQNTVAPDLLAVATLPKEPSS